MGGSLSRRKGKEKKKDDRSPAFTLDSSSERVKTIMFAGIGEAGKNTLFRQINFLYGNDATNLRSDSFLMQGRLQLMLLQMLEQTDKTKELNESMFPNPDTATGDDRKLLDAFEIVSVLSIDLKGDDPITEHMARLIKQFDGVHTVDKVLSAMKYIWKWPGMMEAWNNHWNNYHVNHELLFFFQMLINDELPYQWFHGCKVFNEVVLIPNVREALSDFNHQTLVRTRHRITGMFNIIVEDGSVSKKVSRRTITPFILQTWAVECGLSKEYWYEDVMHAIERFVPKNELFKWDFDYNAEGRKYKWIALGSQRNERKKWINWIPNIETFMYVSSLSFAAGRIAYEETNALEEDLDTFAKLIGRKDRQSSSRGVLVLTKKDTLIELIENGVELTGVWDDFGSMKPIYTDGVGSLDGRPPECREMGNSEWLEYCIDRTVNRIRSLYMAVPGAQDFIEHSIVVDCTNAMDVATKVLSQEVFDVINREHKDVLS